MSRTTKRSTRLKEIEEFLLARHRPVAIAELAQRFDTNRSTIYRSLIDLETEWDVPLRREPAGHVWIDRQRYLTDVRLNLDQTTAVFLAARLLARTSERLDRPLTQSQREYLRCLEALTRAWADGVRVGLVQREAPDLERLFEPYFIEPSAWGFSTYVIGFDHHRCDLRTFKVERLLRVRLTTDTYTIPESFDPYEKLAGAWGVNWGAGGEPTEVVLRFAAGRAAERVREMNWHESQTIEDMPDGGCVLRIVVGSTQEMKPWIRQWGPDCEVLAPAALRMEIGEEMRRAGQVYGF